MVLECYYSVIFLVIWIYLLWNRSKRLWLYLVHLIIATAVATWLLFWKLMTARTTLSSRFLFQPLALPSMFAVRLSCQIHETEFKLLLVAVWASSKERRAGCHSPNTRLLLMKRMKVLYSSLSSSYFSTIPLIFWWLCTRWLSGLESTVVASDAFLMICGIGSINRT